MMEMLVVITQLHENTPYFLIFPFFETFMGQFPQPPSPSPSPSPHDATPVIRGFISMHTKYEILHTM